MFNEAFWFMYAIGVVGYLKTLCTIVAALCGLVGVISLIMCTEEDDKDKVSRFLRFARIWAATCVAALLIAISIPTATSLYAGAGQYVAQASELDQTLLSLKDLLDQKIEELSESE